jgi:type I restriction enzyme S subunit
MGRYDELVSKKTGSGQQNLNGKIIKEIEIDLPPLPEQKAIASVLSSLDDKIDLLHRQNKTLEAMAETLFRQWFIEEAKEDWDEVTVSSLFEVRDGTHDSPKQSPIGYPLVTSKHIGDGVLDF